MKHPLLSKTLWFFAIVMASGGVELIEDFGHSENFDVDALIRLGIGLVGIGLRLVTKDALKRK